MKRLLSIALLAGVVLAGSGAMACEKHINGHQNSSDTNTEGTKKESRLAPAQLIHPRESSSCLASHSSTSSNV